MEDRIGAISATELWATLSDELSSILTETPDTYYMPRIGHAARFTNEERLTAVYILEHFNHEHTDVVELGSGFGLLCILLSAAGIRRICGVEMQQPRHAAAVRLQAVVKHHFPNSLQQLKFLRGIYLQDVTPHADLLLTTNVVNSWWSILPGSEEEKYRTVLHAPDCIADVRLWWTIRETAEEQEEVFNGFNCAGYTNVTHVHGTTWHFSRRPH